jgi:uncharacterized protein (TIGR00288 family)
MVEKGKIVAKKAYADWGRYSSYTEALHEAAIELVEIPRRAQSGKNSADIRLCVDAMDLAYSKEHIDTFIILSGDSDFSPLVSKLKELGKDVIGLGMQNSTSDLLRDNCDEFLYYEDLEQPTAEVPGLDPKLPETKRKAFTLLLDSLLALRRENKEVMWSSMIKDTMKRKKPSFNETYHGYRTFSALLEDAQKHSLIELETDKRSGTYVVTRFGDELHATAPVREERPARRSRRGGTRRTSSRSRSGRMVATPKDDAVKDKPVGVPESVAVDAGNVSPVGNGKEEAPPRQPEPEPPPVEKPRPRVESPPVEKSRPREEVSRERAEPQPVVEKPRPREETPKEREFGFGVFENDAH